jgi:CheY-like chemotaxis protein
MSDVILIIEDNEQNLYLMQFLLEKHGYTVTSAMTGPEGIRMANELLPRAILLDIQLPEMDGYTVAYQIRKNSLLEDTPIIAVTSYAMMGDREKVISAGADDYIEKPINPDTFVSQIEKHILQNQ